MQSTPRTLMLNQSQARLGCLLAKFSKLWWCAEIAMAFAWPLFRAMLNSISKLSLAPLEIANFSSLLIAVKELQELTGYLRGGVTALAAKKTYPVYVDDSIKLFDRISVSAGIRGMQVLIAPSDYVKATDAMLAPLAHKE
jgi:hypothetical protein